MFVAKIAHRMKEASRMVNVLAAWKLLVSATSLVAVLYF